jgi:hypothetical protein
MADSGTWYGREGALDVAARGGRGELAMRSSDRERIVVACAADGRDLMPLAVMLTSLVDCLDPQRALSAYVFDGGISAADRERLSASLERANVGLRWIPSRPSALPDLPVWGRLSPAVYQRLMIPDSLPERLSKAIWLDCDLVVRHDLGALWGTDVGDRFVLAAQDMNVPYVSSFWGVKHYCGRLSEEKGLALLLRAFARLRRRVPTARLRLVGTGPERHHLEQLVHELEVGEAVVFRGWVRPEDVKRELVDAWALVAPSLHAEPLGLVALEALVGGSPSSRARLAGSARPSRTASAGSCSQTGTKQRSCADSKPWLYAGCSPVGESRTRSSAASPRPTI